MMRRLLSVLAVLVLTIAFAWVIGHIHWPERVGLAVSRLSGLLGGVGIEDTENLFMALSFVVSFVAALVIVRLIGARAGRRNSGRRAGLG